jgi:hypothetical protein
MSLCIMITSHQSGLIMNNVSAVLQPDIEEEDPFPTGRDAYPAEQTRVC